MGQKKALKAATQAVKNTLPAKSPGGNPGDVKKAIGSAYQGMQTAPYIQNLTAEQMAKLGLKPGMPMGTKPFQLPANQADAAQRNPSAPGGPSQKPQGFLAKPPTPGAPSALDSMGSQIAGGIGNPTNQKPQAPRYAQEAQRLRGQLQGPNITDQQKARIQQRMDFKGYDAQGPAMGQQQMQQNSPNSFNRFFGGGAAQPMPEDAPASTGEGSGQMPTEAPGGADWINGAGAPPAPGGQDWLGPQAPGGAPGMGGPLAPQMGGAFGNPQRMSPQQRQQFEQMRRSGNKAGAQQFRQQALQPPRPPMPQGLGGQQPDYWTNMQNNMQKNPNYRF